MASHPVRIAAPFKTIDPRDRLIAALFAQLKAERETRETLEMAIRNGAGSREVLEAIAGDPVPAITGDDVASQDLELIEQAIALSRRVQSKDGL
ncbi:hypothetical protein [Agrobacterium sp.]|uniref:hypothetical protein n=1 Tax=Agrobacterium sp. TaxID=361 RepID=UPI0028AE19E3|nr:hypothetical protein [Agrobacterium sp.]